MSISRACHELRITSFLLDGIPVRLVSQYVANVHLRGNSLSYIYLLERFRREYYFNDDEFCEFYFDDSLKKRDYHVFARDPPPY